MTPIQVSARRWRIKGAAASEEDLAVPHYDSLTAAEVVSKLPDVSQIDLAKIESYERKNENRTTVLDRIEALRAMEPWPGYDELTVAEIEAVLDEGDGQRAKDVLTYERAHKNREGVVKSAQRETATA